MKLAVLDFDGTLSKGYISMEFLDYLADNNLIAKDIYKQQMDLVAEYKKEAISYDDWCKDWGLLWAQGLSGKSTDELAKAAKDFFEGFKDNIYSSSIELIKLLKENDYQVIMLSTAAHEVATVAGKYLEMQAVYGTKTEESSGIYTGKLITDLHMRGGKEKIMNELIKEYGKKDSIAIGDSSHDKEILELVEMPVAANPSEELRLAAEKNNWTICSYENIVPEVSKLLH